MTIEENLDELDEREDLDSDDEKDEMKAPDESCANNMTL